MKEVWMRFKAALVEKIAEALGVPIKVCEEYWESIPAPAQVENDGKENG